MYHHWCCAEVLSNGWESLVTTPHTHLGCDWIAAKFQLVKTNVAPMFYWYQWKPRVSHPEMSIVIPPSPPGFMIHNSCALCNVNCESCPTPQDSQFMRMLRCLLWIPLGLTQKFTSHLITLLAPCPVLNSLIVWFMYRNLTKISWRFQDKS